MGDAINRKNIFATVIPTPQIKLAQTAALVTPFQYSPYKNGARNAPASAPQEIPISWAIKAGGSSAITTEIRIKPASSTRIHTNCCFSFIFFTKRGLIKSSVNVELEVSTRLDKVDMDADKTSTITIPIRMSGREDSIVGMMVSYFTVPSTASFTPEIRLKPPRK